MMSAAVKYPLRLPQSGYTRGVPWSVRTTLFALAFLLGVFPLAAQSFSVPLHKAKLGEIHYSARVGSTVVAEGDSFRVIVVPEGGALKSVQVAVVGSVVHGLRFVCSDAQGKTRTTTVGDSTGRWYNPFVIPPERHLVGISGAGGWWIDALRFHLDDGTTSPLYGGAGGDTDFTLLLARRNGAWKGHLMGFWGTTGEHLESLGLVFWPIE